MKNRFLPIILASLLLASATGCEQIENQIQAENEETIEADQKPFDPDLRVMLETHVGSLDPQKATDGTSFEIIADYTDGLMQMDAEGQPVYAIADSAEVSEDGLTYTFHLRDNANWSNGKPVTADDFVFSWQRAVDPETASDYAYMLSDIGQIVNAKEIIEGTKDKSELGAVAIDDKTLEVKLNVPVSYFLSLLYSPVFYPVNEAFYKSVGESFATSAETTLSNGAFVLDEYQSGADTIHLTKNNSYYNADIVKLTGLKYQVVQDSDKALDAFQNGELDISVINGDQVDLVMDDLSLYAIGAGYMWYISPNVNKVKELSNLNIRYAITMALDRDVITSDILKDGSAPTYTAVPMDFAAGPDGSDFSADQTRFKEVCRYDKEAAADYWAKGLSELGITELKLKLIHDSDDAPIKVANVIREQLESTLPGLSIELEQTSKSNRLDRMEDGDYELALTRWGPDYADPMTYLETWVTGNPNNYGLWSSSDYDKLITECTTGKTAMDADRRWEALYDAEQIIMDEAVIFPIYTQCDVVLVSESVSGIEFHPVAINRVYKNTEKN